MACIAQNNPCFIAGDNIYYDLTFTESDKVTPIDLTGAAAKMELRDSVTDASVVQLMSGGIVTPTEGTMRFTLTDTESAALLPRSDTSRALAYSVKLTYSDSTEETIIGGSLTLEQAATE